MEKQYVQTLFAKISRKNKNYSTEIRISDNHFLTLCIDGHTLSMALFREVSHEGYNNKEPLFEKLIFCDLRQEKPGNIKNLSDSLRLVIKSISDEKITFIIEKAE
jgi:hypothetical protein